MQMMQSNSACADVETGCTRICAFLELHLQTEIRCIIDGGCSIQNEEKLVNAISFNSSIAHRLRAVHSALALGQTVTQPCAGSVWHGHTNMQVICCSDEHVCAAGDTDQTSTKSFRGSCDAEMHSCKQAARHTWSTVACTFLVSVVVMVCRAMGC